MMRLAVAVFLLLATAEPSAAGTICGTVRDAQSHQPVPQAAVFLFDDHDQYTGLYAATDQSGAYCISTVPSGTYAIQVRVDDYVAAVVSGVVVVDITGVDIEARPRFYLGEPAPNPASDGVSFRVVTRGDPSVTLEVFDVHGRLVKGWRGEGSLDGTVFWDMRDARGGAVASGVYVVRLRAGHAQQLRRLVCIR
jgi:Carboxypeptidase regulatory-like domain